jgi:hypothetical protein
MLTSFTGKVVNATRNVADISTAAAKATTSLARESLTMALETATIEYDSAGNVIVSLDDAAELRVHLMAEQERNQDLAAEVRRLEAILEHREESIPRVATPTADNTPSLRGGEATTPQQSVRMPPDTPPSSLLPRIPMTPGSALSESDVTQRLTALLEERDELRHEADRQAQALQHQLEKRLRVAEEQRDAAEGLRMHSEAKLHEAVAHASATAERESYATARADSLEAEVQQTREEWELVERARAALEAQRMPDLEAAVRTETAHWQQELGRKEDCLQVALLAKERIQQVGGEVPNREMPRSLVHWSARQQNRCPPLYPLTAPTAAAITLPLSLRISRPASEVGQPYDMLSLRWLGLRTLNPDTPCAAVRCPTCALVVSGGGRPQ